MNSLPGLEALKPFFEASAEAMLVCDLNGTIVYASSQTCTLFDYPAHSLEGQMVEVLLPGSMRERHVQYRNNYARAPRPRAMGAAAELTGQKRDGTCIAVEVVLSPLPIDGVVHIFASVRNVSELPRVKIALQRARYGDYLARIGRIALDTRDLTSLYARVIDLCTEALHADNLMLFLQEHPGRTLTLVYQSQTESARLTSYPIDASSQGHLARMQQTLEPLISADQQTDSQFSADEALPWDDDTHSVLEVPLVRHGEMSGCLCAVANDAGHFSAPDADFMASIGNILSSALMRFETEAQLLHAHRFEALGQLTGGIAHDFNNLLTIVSGNLQLIEEIPEIQQNPDNAEFISAALAATYRGAELTSKLLSFSRRQLLKPQSLLVSQLLASLKALLTRTLGSNIQLYTRLSSGNLACRADPAQLESALLNLALNARDAMPLGGRLTLDVTQAQPPASVLSGSHVRTSEAGLPMICIAVSDTGSGMSAEVRERAFEPFYTTKALGKGTGLGLPMVYGFIKQSGGYVTIDSQPGHGTTVRLFLPQSTEAPVVDTNPRSAQLHGSGSILLVEDEPEVRKIGIEFLRSLGYAVHAAADAEQALALLAQQGPFDLLFTDVVLTGTMNGPELAERAGVLQPGLKVLYTSGYAAGNPLLARIPPAQRRILQKPYRRSELARRIQAALEESE